MPADAVAHEPSNAKEAALQRILRGGRLRERKPLGSK
jgi:hypothetical protein